MDDNRYSPPTAAVADFEPSLFRRRGVLMVILLTLVTGGLYVPIWFIRRRDAFNRLDSPRKLPLWPFVGFIVIIAIDLTANIARAVSNGEAVPLALQLLVSMTQLAFGITFIVMCFRAKGILEDHLAGPADGSMPVLAERVRLSPVMTFFFQNLYLQFIINRHLAALRSGR